MAFIEQIKDDAATGAASELLEADRSKLGYVQNFTRAWASRPDVYAGWAQMKDAIMAGMSLRRYELATVASASTVGSSYCTLAHGRILARKFMDAESVRALVEGRPAGLDEADEAVVELARKVAGNAWELTQEDIDGYRAAGLDDEEIFAVILAAAARCFFTKVTDAIGVLPDAAFNELEPELRDALTVGRPIAATAT
jgi:uncharacterized peroxidase-related enzyme